jgi:hypothetical protein
MFTLRITAEVVAVFFTRLAARVRLVNLGPAAALVGLTLVCGPRLQAAQLVQYLQVPASGTLISGSIFNLPNYGNVQVSISGETATFFDQVNGYNQSAGPYTWGTDTQRLGVLNTNSGNVNYTLNFAFLSGAPNPNDLLLNVTGLAIGTTTTVSQPGSLVAEYTFPASGFYPAGPSSTTVLSGQTFSSLGNADRLNTGWALDQPSGSFTNLSLSVNQISGDGIGFTLGYATPEPSTMILGGLGLLSLVAVARRSRLSRLAIASLLFVSMAFGTAAVAHAQVAPGSSISGTVGFTFSFDEQGNSLLNGGPNPNLVFLMPGGGIQFTLPGPVIAGDVLVTGISDVTPGNNGISDLLSFSNNTANQGVLTYLSLIDDATETDAADHPNFNTVTTYSVNEVGPEGANGFQWIPDPANLSGAIYNGVSDGVLSTPEPSTFIMGGLGLLSLAALAYRRRLARTPGASKRT